MIGISTSCLPKSNWNKIIENIKIKAIELDLRKSHLPDNDEILNKKVRPFLKNYFLTIHTRIKVPIKSKLMEEIIKEDIKISNILGARNIVVHVDKTSLNGMKEDIKFVKSLTDSNVLLENNSRGLFSEAEKIIRILKETGTKLCFDVGHAEIFCERNGIDIVKYHKELRNFILEYHIKGTYFEDYDTIFDPRKNPELYKDIVNNKRLMIVETEDINTTLITFSLIKHTIFISKG